MGKILTKIQNTSNSRDVVILNSDSKSQVTKTDTNSFASIQSVAKVVETRLGVSVVKK